MQFFIPILIAVIIGLAFFFGTKSSYEKAGAGQTYNLTANSVVDITNRVDHKLRTTNRVDRNFYASSQNGSIRK